MNFLYGGVFTSGNTNGISSFTGSGANALVMDLSPWTGLADNSQGLGAGPAPTEPWTSDANLSTLIDRMNTLLVAGQLSATGKQYIYDFVKSRSISSISQANPTLVTTTSAHGLQNGDTVVFSSVTGGTYSPAITNSTLTVSNVTSTTFNVQVNCTVAPNAGQLANAAVSPVGYVNAAPSATHLRDRIRAVVHLILTSPDYTIQR